MPISTIHTNFPAANTRNKKPRVSSTAESSASHSESVVIYESPKRDAIHKALAGVSENDADQIAKCEPIAFVLYCLILCTYIQVSTAMEQVTVYLLEVPETFAALLKKPSVDFNFKVNGTLRFDKNLIRGIGSFKTAHDGELQLDREFDAPDALSSGQVVVKRVYYDKRNQRKTIPGPALEIWKNGRVGRYSIQDELLRLVREANTIAWAACLLGLVYEYIDRLHDSGTEQPPFAIPKVSFVGAAIATVYVGATTPKRAYLLEQFINPDDTTELFVKYMNNRDAVPEPFLKDLDEDVGGVGSEDADGSYTRLGKFFMFCQHVQYEKTGGLAFISDFQGKQTVIFWDSTDFYFFGLFAGGKSRLSDPQIITKPYVYLYCIINHDINLNSQWPCKKR